MLFNTEDDSLPSDSPEERRHFAGIIDNVGNDMNFNITNSSTNKIMNMSNVRHANDDEHLNLWDDHITSPETIKSLRDDDFKAEDST